MTTDVVEPLPPIFARARWLAFVVGAGSLIACALIGLVHRGAFFPAYLAAYLFWVGIPLGCLAALTLHYLVGGAWGFAIRRPLEAAVMTLPLMALLFLPLVLGLQTLYPWARPSAAHDPVLLHKAPYLNVNFWLARTAGYFVFWIGLAWLLNRGARRQAETTDPAPTWRLQTLSAPALPLHFLVVTFAAMDWGMSIDPHWYSTIYGTMVFVGQSLSGLAMMILVATLLKAYRPPAASALSGPEPFHELGNLTLAFVMLWAYMSFSQFLIIWSGNLTEEIPWYLARSAGGWRYICGLLMLFHFFVPFFVLLSREVKRESRTLWRVAAGLLVMHLLNDIWLIVPSRTYGGGLFTALVAVLAAVGIGGVWVAVFLWRLGQGSLTPSPNDPLLADVLEHAHEQEGAHG